MNVTAGKESISRVIVSTDNSPFNTLMVLNLRDDLDVLSFISENIAQSSHTVSAPDERGKDDVYLQSRISCELADIQWYVSMIGGFNGNSYVHFYWQFFYKQLSTMWSNVLYNVSKTN